VNNEPNPNSLSIALNPDGTVSLTFPENEIMARFLVDKLRCLLDMEFHKRTAMAQAQAQQPRVIPANGSKILDAFPGFKRGNG
jgi:hypothetical protein